MNDAMIAEPPYDMNGSGMPVIGMMPIVMPMFSNTWNAKIASTPTASSVPKKSDDSSAVRQSRHDQHAVEADQRRAAEEAELLAHHGEDEVGVLLGHVRPFLVCRPLNRPCARDPAGDDRDLRLARGCTAPAVCFGRGLVDGRLVEEADDAIERYAATFPVTTAAPTSVTPISTQHADVHGLAARRPRAPQNEQTRITSVVPRSCCRNTSAIARPAMPIATASRPRVEIVAMLVAVAGDRDDDRRPW